MLGRDCVSGIKIRVIRVGMLASQAAREKADYEVARPCWAGTVFQGLRLGLSGLGC